MSLTYTVSELEDMRAAIRRGFQEKRWETPKEVDVERQLCTYMQNGTTAQDLIEAMPTEAEIRELNRQRCEALTRHMRIGHGVVGGDAS